LGHVVGRQGLKVDQKKTQAIAGWPTPKDVQQARQFLGLTNYFRKFIRHYTGIAAPLQELTDKGAQFIWGDRQEFALHELKACVEHLC